MIQTLRRAAASATLGFVMLTAAGPSVQAQQATAPAPVAKHHSKLKGALVGAAAGHVLGGHEKGGAIAGALWQHHKNKKAAQAK